MKIIKKSLAVLLALVMLLAMTGCHGKDEVALTINGVEIKSALYINALLECDSEAKTRVDEEMADEEVDGDEFNYYAQTLDGLNYVDYVKQQALERCKEYALFQTLVDNKTISLTEEEIVEAESYAQTYWAYYYSSTYEANGISYDTYKKADVYAYYSNAYFQHIYGEGGEKEVDTKTISDKLYDEYQLVYMISKTYDSDSTDAEKKEVKSKLEAYAERLEKGESFETIYKEENPDTSTTEEESDSADTTDTTDEADKTAQPKDLYAQVIGSENTSDPDDNFDTVYDMKKGQVKVIEDEDKSGVVLYVKLDISEDDYYLTAYKDTILYMLKEDEFNSRVKEEVADYKVEENKYAINRFKVKKLKYPTSES